MTDSVQNFAVARNFTLAYDGNTAVDSSDLDIPVGRLTAIIGPNGSGKSTVLHALAGLIQAQSGSFQVLGGSPADSKSRMSYVMQSVAYPQGIPLSVREIVGMGRYPSRGWFGRFGASDRERIDAVMDRLAVTDLSKRHLDELSGGQRQRVYVAQGLAQDHDVLLLDEPLTGLDIVSARTIDEIIHDETDAGRTVVHTTHDLDEARAADHVVLMSNRVVAFGAPEKVLTDANLRAAYNLGGLHETTGLIVDDPHRAC
ncbi:metal ABC transporter ATP-binding protein [Corynebacterium alimapuense]|uniref:Metal ABC transporter ATP-binding protein n=1 Tax=Corynebacterium alimapuense TaxID=1576874 RepID=A0A3M8KAF9_9CORY|nr:metal ABC transporter ATP-binding protein [Corynebacterium alimapuense]RNE49534.1 metal ABC transporter ATP-binding protein [Corynebacterium alimapuense]